MSAERPTSAFEQAVAPHLEFLYRVAVTLAGRPRVAEDAVVGTLREYSRSWNGAPPDRGLLLGALYRRLWRRAVSLAGRGSSLHVLSPSYRDVVTLSALPGVHVDEVAVALGIPVQTVRTRRRRAFALMFRRWDRVQ